MFLLAYTFRLESQIRVKILITREQAEKEYKSLAENARISSVFLVEGQQMKELFQQNVYSA